MPDPSPLLEALERFRAQLDAKEQAALNRLIKNYLGSWERLSGSLDSLLLKIGETPPTRGQLVRMVRYRSLISQIETELSGLQVLTGNEIQEAADLGIKLGRDHMAELISTAITGGPEIATVFNTLPTGAIETLIGFLDPGSPLYLRLQLLAPTAADAVVRAMTEGITIGLNPRDIANQVRTAFGRGLTDSLRFVRTAQIWAYREANRAVMVQHQDVVKGWVWVAALGDPRTCMSCVSMHGTVHQIWEPLNDHHNGRCRPAPLVEGYDNPVPETGVDWFQKQNEAVQRNYMGKGKYEAWQQGKFTLDQIPGERTDEVYGPMRIEKTLKELLGE